MAMGLNRNGFFTVKYVEGGKLEFVDIPAVGMTEAKDKFLKDYPGREVVNIYRKS
jgi:hypothetical protein